jgi:hypothetical protein
MAYVACPHIHLSVAGERQIDYDSTTRVSAHISVRFTVDLLSGEMNSAGFGRSQTMYAERGKSVLPRIIEYEGPGVDISQRRQRHASSNGTSEERGVNQDSFRISRCSLLVQEAWGKSAMPIGKAA